MESFGQTAYPNLLGQFKFTDGSTRGPVDGCYKNVQPRVVSPFRGCGAAPALLIEPIGRTKSWARHTTIPSACSCDL
jgi:hypothetical protein